jgi:hypothetical protein
MTKWIAIAAAAAVLTNMVLWAMMLSKQKDSHSGSRVLEDWTGPKELFDRSNYTDEGQRLFPFFVASSVVSMMCVVAIIVLRLVQSL